jgi:hypothetical protein
MSRDVHRHGISAWSTRLFTYSSHTLIMYCVVQWSLIYTMITKVYHGIYKVYTSTAHNDSILLYVPCLTSIIYRELPQYTVNSLHKPWTPMIYSDLTVNYVMYLVYDSIWWYNAVFPSMCRYLAKFKNMHNPRKRTKYLLHTRGQTEQLSYEHCFLGSSKTI